MAWSELDAMLCRPTPAFGIAPSIWEQVCGAHVGHQLGLEILGLLPHIAHTTSFYDLRLRDDLGVEIPARLLDPKHQDAMRKVLVPPPATTADQIVAAMGGTFFAQEAPHLPAFVTKGAHFEKGGYGQFAELGPGYVPLRNRNNDYLIDREEQKHRSFTGVRGIAEQDAMAQDSQGLIAERSREHLSATDVGVVRFRRYMLEAVKALRDGREPDAPRRPAAYRVRAGGAVAPSSLSFEQVMQQRFGSATGRIEQ